MNINKNLQFRRYHYHQSTKAGLIYCDSSYELKAAIILDADTDVMFYENQIRFKTITGKSRVLDFLVTKQDGSKEIIEVKPFRRIYQYPDQIEDNRQHAIENGQKFFIWSESNLGFSDERDATKWADEYLSKTTGIDYVAIRKKRACERTMRHYKKHIADNKIEVFCEFCKTVHRPLKMTYDKNILRNGHYVCEAKGGHITGSKPKVSLRKDNPHASDGKKECTNCKGVKSLSEFGIDKSRKDGYANRCKICRAAIETKKYRNAKNHEKEKQITPKGSR